MIKLCQRQQLILRVVQGLAMHQIRVPANQPLIGLSRGCHCADIHGLARLFVAIQRPANIGREQCRHVTQHEGFAGRGGHAPLTVHNQGNVTPCQVKGDVRGIELDRDRAEWLAVSIVDAAGYEIGGGFVQAGNAEHFTTAGAQCVEEVGPARIDLANDAE
ncbi:hypothetical protein D3C81_1669250 [compost metagenome]